MAIRVEDGWDGDGDDEETDEFGGEIIGIWTVEKAIEKRPNKGGGEGDFDVFPGGFVDGGKETDGAVVVSPIVQKMS